MEFLVDLMRHEGEPIFEEGIDARHLEKQPRKTSARYDIYDVKKCFSPQNLLKLN